MVIKDPDWYLTNQTEPDKFYSNLIFLAISIYLYSFNKILSFLFFLLYIFSSLFHYETNTTTLALDRISMVLIFSYFFNIFYNKISFFTYSLIGVLSVIYWYYTENLIFYFMFQFIGLLLFLLNVPLDILTKLGVLGLYGSFTYSQLIEEGKYHSLKHVALGGLAVYLINKLT